MLHYLDRLSSFPPNSRYKMMFLLQLSPQSLSIYALLFYIFNKNINENNNNIITITIVLIIPFFLNDIIDIRLLLIII